MHLLWLKTDLLHPIDKGGKIRSYYMLRELKKVHRITYLALDDGTAAPDAAARATEYCHELIRVPHRTSAKLSPAFFGDLVRNLCSRLPYAVQKYRSAEFRRKVAETIGKQSVDLVVCDFLFPSVNLPEPLHRPAVLFQHNVEASIWRRHAEVRANRMARLYFFEQWRRMRAFERTACRKFDAVVAVSADERASMEREYGLSQVYDIPTGVDTDYYRPSSRVEPDPSDLVFTGSMDWLPNDDAMKYFVRDILPTIRASIPGVTVTIVGRNPFPGLAAMARQDPNIRVTGRVDDVRPYMERASVYIIPLRIGGGTRLKVFEAMAMGKPIVSTSLGVEGLPVIDGHDVVIADQPQAFADSVLRLLRDRTFAERIGTAAAAKVRTHFGWEPVVRSFLKACHHAVNRHALKSSFVSPIGGAATLVNQLGVRSKG